MSKFFQIGDRFNISKVFADLFDKVVIVNNLNDLDSFEDNDVIAFEGGTDISPSIYGEKPHTFCGAPDVARDEFETAVFKKYVGRAYFLGICRGSQLLCALSGGKLIQHVDNHGRDHIMEYNLRVSQRNATCMVTSTHHQMMYPYNLPRQSYCLLGWSAINLSEVYKGYIDGVPLADFMPKKMLEPEIIYFINTRSLAIQFHPEFMDMESAAVAVARDSVSNFLISQQENIKELKSVRDVWGGFQAFPGRAVDIVAEVAPQR